MYLRLAFMEANTLNPDQGAKQSDLGTYCLQHRLHRREQTTNVVTCRKGKSTPHPLSVDQVLWCRYSIYIEY